MPKYDAFGREIGEDTLSGLGGDSSARARAEPSGGGAEEQLADAATVTPGPAAEAPPEPAVAEPLPRRPQASTFTVQHVAGPRRRGAGVGCLVGLVILAAIAVGPVIALIGFVGDAGDTIDEITDTIDGIAPNPERAAPAGIAGASMVARTNFAKALARMRAARLGRVGSIRLSPDRVGARLVKGARVRDARIDFEGAFERGELRPGATNASTIGLSAIDTGAPVRLVRGSRRYGVRPRGIDYLVLTPGPSGDMRWVAYFKRGIYVEGDAHGKVTRRIS